MPFKEFKGSNKNAEDLEVPRGTSFLFLLLKNLGPQ
jgi:hypothetical protein